MVSRFNMILQGTRDIALMVVSALTMSTSYAILASETSQEGEFAYLVFGAATAFFIFSILNLTLLLRKVKAKAFFYFNAIIQLFPSFLFAVYSLWIGPVFIVLNVAIIVTLIERKSKQKPK